MPFVDIETDEDLDDMVLPCDEVYGTTKQTWLSGNSRNFRVHDWVRKHKPTLDTISRWTGVQSLWRAAELLAHPFSANGDGTYGQVEGYGKQLHAFKSLSNSVWTDGRRFFLLDPWSAGLAILIHNINVEK